MSIQELVHTINNQLAIVMGRAELLSVMAEDQKTKKSCAEIEDAAQKIKSLLTKLR